MNLIDSCFLCLDIGTHTVRGAGVRIVSGRIARTAMHSFTGSDTAFAIRNVVDAIEMDIGAQSDSAYLTGNFGTVEFKIAHRTKSWNFEHRISDADVASMISEIPELSTDFVPMHIIPLRYDLPDVQNIKTPIGQISQKLDAAFGVIGYDTNGFADIRAALRAAHLHGHSFFDPSFLVAGAHRDKNESVVLIDFGATSSTVSVWTPLGPVFIKKIPGGGVDVTQAIAENLGLSLNIAESVKHENMSAIGGDMDRFTPAGAQFDFTRADVIESGLPILNNIVDDVASAVAVAAEKYRAARVIIFGGSSNIPGIENMVSAALDLPVKNVGADAAVQSLARHIWRAAARRANALAKKTARREAVIIKTFEFFKKIFARKKKKTIIPIMPATLAFNMQDPATYKLFESGGISMIHVDIMDGLYVERIVGDINQLKFIRKSTTAHLNVHLMVENPLSWIKSVADAGADTITVSTGTFGVIDSIREIKNLKKRAGVALHPNAKVSSLTPILRDLDEVLVMSVIPGAGGQKFVPDALRRIASLASARKKYNLKFKISVDGGINSETAQECWAAGADYLMSGSYLANAPDFAMAVQSLLPQG